MALGLALSTIAITVALGGGHRVASTHRTGDHRHPLTSAVPAACTPARNAQALLDRAGPFCLPPDAIRALDHPVSVPLGSAHLASSEPVLAVTIRGRTRAYPVRVLVSHEIVNDAVAGVPVAVTFCPLCNSGVAFDRRVAGRVLTFAVSGRLLGANLVMFDRQTETLWVQLTGETLSGPLRGERLRPVPVRMLAWRDFRAAWPGATVVTGDAEIEDPYGGDPYSLYGRDPHRPSIFQFGSRADPRLPPMARVLGVALRERSAAIALPPAGRGARVVAFRMGGRRLTALLSFGIGQPSTGPTFARERRGWAGGVYRPRVDGRVLHLRPSEGGFLDAETGSLFDVAGRAISGPLTGRRLTPVSSTTAFWFAWVRFHPATEVIRVPRTLSADGQTHGASAHA